MLPHDLVEPIGFKKAKCLEELEHREIVEDDYKQKLKGLQFELLRLQRELSDTKNSVLVVFEGPDAAGKGGAIKRITERLDPRLLRVRGIL